MSSIGSIGSSSNPTNSADAFSALTSGEFLQIIFTELQNQDPLEPNDTSAMLDQLATLRSIESDTQMVDSLSSLVSQTEFAAASSLIGSLVSGITLDNRRVADLVVSVSNTPDGPVLNLFDGSRMFFGNVDEIVGPIDEPNPDDNNNDDDDDDDNNGDDNNNGGGGTVTPPNSAPIDTDGLNSDTVPGGNGTTPVQKTVSNDV
jgi:flagellar basal-body rod modification protein FlgD